MTYEQQVEPDLSIIEEAGWCLRFTERSFGVPLLYPTAWAAWQATQAKHQDKDFPGGVTVPVWFDWWGDVGSGRAQYGHVGYRTPDGKIHSAPGTGTGSMVFNSVDELTRYFGGGMTYVGWSEDIAGVNVIKQGEEYMPNDGDVKNVYQAADHRAPTDKEMAHFLALPTNHPDGILAKAITDLRNKDADIQLKQKQIDELSGKTANCTPEERKLLDMISSTMKG